MRHSDLRLTMNVYTDPKLLDIHGALDSLPSLARPAETEQATGTSGLVPPLIRQNELISDNSGGANASNEVGKRNKVTREEPCLPKLLEVDPIGIEPTTSTLPVIEPTETLHDKNRGDGCTSDMVPPKVPPSLRDFGAELVNVSELQTWIAENFSKPEIKELVAELQAFIAAKTS